MATEDAELVRLRKVISANSGKSFVKRISNPSKYPTLANEDGSVSTHSMAWVEDDRGRGYVYPTVQQEKDGTLRRYEWREAWAKAKQSGEYIRFDDKTDADWFSKKYKRLWE